MWRLKELEDSSCRFLHLDRLASLCCMRCLRGRSSSRRLRTNFVSDWSASVGRGVGRSLGLRGRPPEPRRSAFAPTPTKEMGKKTTKSNGRKKPTGAQESSKQVRIPQGTYSPTSYPTTLHRKSQPLSLTGWQGRGLLSQNSNHV